MRSWTTKVAFESFRDEAWRGMRLSRYGDVIGAPKGKGQRSDDRFAIGDVSASGNTAVSLSRYVSKAPASRLECLECIFRLFLLFFRYRFPCRFACLEFELRCCSFSSSSSPPLPFFFSFSISLSKLISEAEAETCFPPSKHSELLLSISNGLCAGEKKSQFRTHRLLITSRTGKKSIRRLIRRVIYEALVTPARNDDSRDKTLCE